VELAFLNPAGSETGKVLHYLSPQFELINTDWFSFYQQVMLLTELKA
jgi:hypothetical protein